MDTYTIFADELNAVPPTVVHHLSLGTVPTVCLVVITLSVLSIALSAWRTRRIANQFNSNYAVVETRRDQLAIRRENRESEGS